MQPPRQQHVTPKVMWVGDDYTIIIGHRRAAAAQQAGLYELPCAIVEMDEREQMQTMMVENMQRSDLTVYEQAQGFQMMMDFGQTVSRSPTSRGSPSPLSGGASSCWN